MAITLHQAKMLGPNKTLYHVSERNADGTPERWRVNGAVRTWKRHPDKIYVPLKYGLYDYDALTECDLDVFCLTEAEAIAEGERLGI